jgi:threonine dehydratase
MQIHAYDQEGALLGQGTVGSSSRSRRRSTRCSSPWRRRLIGGIAAWYAGKVRIIGVEPVARADAHESAGGGKAGRCARRRHRRGSLAPKQVGQLMFPLRRNTSRR